MQLRTMRWFTILLAAAFALAACGDDEAAQPDPLEISALTATPTDGQAPLEVTFTLEATGGSEPYEAVWDFGDDSGVDETITGLEATHTYYLEGTYTTEVTLTDGQGNTTTEMVDVTVAPADPPTVTATATPEMGIAPLDTTFETTVDGDSGEYEYEWQFGDGAFSNEANPAHRYIVGGTYEAQVTVTDVMTEKSTTETVTIEVADDERPFVSATADPARGIAPLNVALDAQSFGGNEPLTYSWDFGDGSDPVDGKNPSHEYTNPGQYKAVVTVEDADGDVAYSEVTVNVLDNAVPSVDIFADKTSGIAPLTVQFDPQAQGGEAPLTFAWDFGNGDTADTRRPSYQFTDAGTYTVTVTATDATGDTAQDTVDIEVTSDDVPTVSVTATPTSGLAPLPVQFDATATGGNGTLEYTWSFGEGSTSTMQDPLHTYTVASTYTATVTVRDENGDTASDSVDITVGDDLTPVASASASPTRGKAPLTVDFFGNANGGNGALIYSWSFNDGSAASSDQNPTHTFTTPGTYDVSLIVTDGDGSSDQSSVTIEVLDDAQPTVVASAAPTNGIAPFNVQFDATVSDGDAPFTYSWDFGDSSAPADIQRPQHSYTTGGTFTATVTVTDADGDTTSDTVDISVADDEVPTVTGSSSVDTGTAPLTVDFSATGAGGNGALSYTWYFGDGSAPVVGQAASHTYTNTGVYEATVVATDSNGDTARDSIQINVRADAPDLVVDSFTATRTDNDVEYELVIRNAGTADQVHPFSVRFYNDLDQAPTAATSYDDSYTVSTVIPAGDTRTITEFEYNLQLGNYDAWALIDPIQEAPDLDRSNNVAGPTPFIVDGVQISEIYYDTPGADDADATFIELFGAAGMDLSGYVLDAINGSDGSSYDSWTLPAGTTIPADGYLVVGTSAHPDADVTVADPDLQNGPDSLVLRDGQGGVADAVGYGDFTGIFANFAGEGSPARAAAEGYSIGRSTSQSDTEGNSIDFYGWSQPTPGAPNEAVLVNNADTCTDAYNLNGGAEGSFIVEGNLGAATNTFTSLTASPTQGYCSATSSSFSGPDQIFKITVPTGQTATVEFDLDDNANVDIDGLLTADPCTSLDTGFVGCNPALSETFTLSEGDYYFVVLEDGTDLATSDEPYRLTVDVTY